MNSILLHVILGNVLGAVSYYFSPIHSRFIHSFPVALETTFFRIIDISHSR